MIKKINFPAEEWSSLKNRGRIITTRVSREYGLYNLGQVVQTPWQESYIVTKVEKISDIKNHPYYHDLTQPQIRQISKYKKIEVLTLKKCETS